MSGSSAEPWVVTTPRKRFDLNAKAEETAARLNLRFAVRGDNSVDKLLESMNAKGLYVETDGAPLIQTSEGAFRFHENTSGQRTKNLGATDALLRALEPRPSDNVLDATLGIACDALVIATALTGGGKLVGLESCPILADMTRRGIESCDIKAANIREASRRIHVVSADHSEYMRRANDGEFDLVYFDPMFPETVAGSAAMRRMRAVADERPLSAESISQAIRIAARRVVVKGRRGYFNDIRFSKIIESGRSIYYGVIEV